MKRIRLKRRMIVFVAIGIILAVTAVIGYVLWQRYDVEVKKEAEITAQKAQAEHDSRVQARDILKELEKNRPVADAPLKDKINYYTQVAAMKSVLSEYNKAIEAFREAERLSGDALLSIDAYLSAARTFKATGDSATAQELLSKADAAVLLEKDEAYRASATLDVKRLREELL